MINHDETIDVIRLCVERHNYQGYFSALFSVNFHVEFIIY